MIRSNTDILESFVLRSDLSWPQNIVLNYAMSTKDKAETIGKALNFISRSAAQKAMHDLKVKYKVISVDKDGSIKVNMTFTRRMHEYQINNKIGRPTKHADGQV